MRTTLDTVIRTEETARQFLADHQIQIDHLLDDEGRVVIPNACHRCGGSGYGHWFQDGGRCYECHGANTRNRVIKSTIKQYAQQQKRRLKQQQKAREAADAKHAAKLESQRNWSEANGHGRLTFDELDAKRRQEREAERKAAPAVKPGRQVIRGQILKVAEQSNAYGTTWKMTVKDEAGRCYWGTVPSDIDLTDCAYVEPDGTIWKFQETPRAGDCVQFTGTVTASDRDHNFGFFKRPAKAEYLSMKPRRGYLICEPWDERKHGPAYELQNEMLREEREREREESRLMAEQFAAQQRQDSRLAQAEAEEFIDDDHEEHAAENAYLNATAWNRD